MKKIKLFTVDDFIIFLKTKIAIILFSTFLLSLIAGFFQVSYKDNWKVEISRTVDNSSLVKTIILIKNQAVLNFKKFDEPRAVDPMSLMIELNDLINSSIINYLSNADIKYTGIKKPKNNVNLLRKEVYNLIIEGSDTKNESIIKHNLYKLFKETHELTNEIIKIKYELEPTYNPMIYNFKVIKVLRVEGYNYVKILKIVLINLVVSIFFIFIFHIRKNISLF